jgi:hypothetical protein
MSESKKESKMVVRTAIADLPVAGDEIPEESLRLVSGGRSSDGDTGGPCGACH